MTTITLTHYDLGRIKVEVWDEATWWLRKRQWTCPDDPELGSFEDEDFEEGPDRIASLLAAAKRPAPVPPPDHHAAGRALLLKAAEHPEMPFGAARAAILNEPRHGAEGLPTAAAPTTGITRQNRG